jgi:PAS domain S-box-containing protein
MDWNRPRDEETILLDAGRAAVDRPHEPPDGLGERGRSLAPDSLSAEAASDGILAIDEASTILFANPAVERLFGFQRGELVGRSLTLLIPEPLRPRHLASLARYLETGEKHIPWSGLELPGVHKSGRGVSLEISFGEFQEGGKRRFTGVIREISHRKRAHERLTVQYLTSQVLAEARTIQDAVPRILRAVCESLDWALGQFWILDRKSGVLKSGGSWHAPGTDYTAFEVVSREWPFRPGVGLPGRIWATGKPAWIPDVTLDRNFPRISAAAQLGLHSAFGFPILAGKEMEAAMEFFSPHIREPDQPLLAMLEAIGNQIGQFLERKRAEEALQESEERFRVMADTAPVMIWMTGPDRSCTYLNKRWRDFTGQEGEEGMSGEWVKGVHPEELATLLGRFAAAVEGRRGFSLEHRLRRFDGQYRWVLDTGIPRFTRGGSFAGFIGSAVDITDQKRNAQELLAVKDELSVQLGDMTRLQGLSMRLSGRLDLEPLLEETLAAVASLQGGSRGVMLLERDGRGRWALAASLGLGDDSRRAAERFLAGEAAGGGPVPEPRILAGDDLLADPLWGEMARVDGFGCLSMTPLHTRGGERLGAIAVFFSASKRPSEGQLRMVDLYARQAAGSIENARLYQKLQEEDTKKDEFLAMLAHELRNPLAAVSFGLDALQLFTPDHPTFDQARAVMGKNIHHMTRLLDDLLDLSRITRGKIELKRTPLELAAVLASALESARPRILECGLELDLSLPSEPLRLLADPTRLEQVLSNLLSNAIKFSDRGGRIRISAGREGREVALRIEDNGIGIEADLLPHIFDLFIQGDRSLDRSQGGLGIGLTLVRSLVELHQGTVEALSEGTGKGSRFTVRLPLLPKEAGGEPVARPRPVTAAAQPRRVMVVDDNSDSASMMATLLEKEGHQVRIAHDGPAALEEARSYRPEVVFIDIGLPGMDGYQVARELRALADLPRPLLVALTGYAQEEHRHRSREAGFDGHLVKPVALETLKKALAELPRAGASLPGSQ